MDLVNFEEGVRFVYIYTKRDGKLYFIADSEPNYSKDYSPPGQEYLEHNEIDAEPFKDGKTIITKPVTDYWGTWVRILVPMKESSTGEIIAVLGMDYPAKLWSNNAFNNTIHAIISVIALFLVLIAFYIIFSKNIILKKVNGIITVSEEKFSKAFHSNAALMAISTVTDELFLDVNEMFLETLGYKKEEVIGKKITDLNIFIDDRQREKIRNIFENSKVIRNAEVFVNSKDGSIHSCFFSIDKIVIGEIPCWITMMIDNTEHKKAEEKIFFLSYHDQLTGLYNRRFYAEELKKLDNKENLPLTVVMGDVNGLKLINDSFGHEKGDLLLKKVAEVLIKGCRKEDIIARIGGDEFVLLLPKTDSCQAEKIVNRIKNIALDEKIDSIDISVSFGYETKYNEYENIKEIFKNADKYMYKKKLVESSSMKGKTINVIINTLHEKNKREEEHSLRVSELCKKMGKALELPEYKVIDLSMAGLFHDIGKIAIDEKILNKEGKLTHSEFEEIKRHSEIGYRILSSSNDMSDIAEYILAHHEKWNGKGYPKGLKEKEIPFESRILSIVDTYDAITSDRSYRKAFSEEFAIEELQKNARIQFDPELVNIFIKKVLLDNDFID
ncbi:HD domain-containing phosphohydrolase [Anaerovorax odorimutans]|uniref:HD domain-containing phosphohydrolase n=1 Tax=Anaerovorax odorimutans TaxID=109327 RepID=UPI0004133428|nr:HD domain-containing phosphohydrolase [Anaerovorax odorimutans]